MKKEESFNVNDVHEKQVTPNDQSRRMTDGRFQKEYTKAWKQVHQLYYGRL